MLLKTAVNELRRLYEDMPTKAEAIRRAVFGKEQPGQRVLTARKVPSKGSQFIASDWLFDRQPTLEASYP